MCRFVGICLLVAGVEAFAPAPIRWGGLPGKEFFLAPSSPPNKALVLPSALMISDPSVTMSLEEVPHFVMNPDNTISWDDDLCLEAAGVNTGDVIRVNRCTGDRTQLWDFVSWNHGQQNLFRLKGSNKCIDVKDEIGLNGAPVELRECDMNRMGESWRFEEHLQTQERLARHPVSSNSVRNVMFYCISMAGLGALSLSILLWRGLRTNRPIVRQSCDIRGLEYFGAHHSCQGGVSLCTPAKSHRDGVPLITTPAVMAISPAPVKTTRGERVQEITKRGIESIPFATDPLVSERKPTHAKLHTAEWEKRHSLSHGMLLPSKHGARQNTAIRIPSLQAARHPHVVGLFRGSPFAPPSPDGLLSKVAELVLRSRLTKIKSVSVNVESTPLEMLRGCVRGVTVRGEGWCTPLRLSCAALDVRVGRTEISLQKLVEKQWIFMKTPARGTATMVFTASDWKDFLAHPLTKQALGKHLVQTPVKPLVQFNSEGEVLFEPASTTTSSGLVIFPVSWGAYHFDAALGQDGSSPFVTAKLDEQTAGRMTASERNDVRQVEAWVATFFKTLVLDLDGCALSFRSMKVSTEKAGSKPLLSLDLDVCVTRFPSLDINF